MLATTVGQSLPSDRGRRPHQAVGERSRHADSPKQDGFADGETANVGDDSLNRAALRQFDMTVPMLNPIMITAISGENFALSCKVNKWCPPEAPKRRC